LQKLFKLSSRCGAHFSCAATKFSTLVESHWSAPTTPRIASRCARFNMLARCARRMRQVIRLPGALGLQLRCFSQYKSLRIALRYDVALRQGSRLEIIAMLRAKQHDSETRSHGETVVAMLS